jgi:hypothetical protein
MSEADANLGDRAAHGKRNVIHKRSHRAAQNAPATRDLPETSATRGRRPRSPMSPKHCSNLSVAQSSYVRNDPRWPEHRRKLVAAQQARRMTLFPSEVQTIVEMRQKGRTLREISDKIGVCVEVLRREMRENGVDPGNLRKIVLSPDEARTIQCLRERGRTLEYISAEIGVCVAVVRRELRALGIATARLKTKRRARRRGNCGWGSVLAISERSQMDSRFEGGWGLSRSGSGIGK